MCYINSAVFFSSHVSIILVHFYTYISVCDTFRPYLQVQIHVKKKNSLESVDLK
jgi:hypothetical protein